MGTSSRRAGRLRSTILAMVLGAAPWPGCGCEDPGDADAGADDDGGAIAGDAGTIPGDAGGLSDDGGPPSDDAGALPGDAGATRDAGNGTDDAGSATDDAGSATDDAGAAGDVGGGADAGASADGGTAPIVIDLMNPPPAAGLVECGAGDAGPTLSPIENVLFGDYKDLSARGDVVAVQRGVMLDVLVDDGATLTPSASVLTGASEVLVLDDRIVTYAPSGQPTKMRSAALATDGTLGAFVDLVQAAPALASLSSTRLYGDGDLLVSTSSNDVRYARIDANGVGASASLGAYQLDHVEVRDPYVFAFSETRFWYADTTAPAPALAWLDLPVALGSSYHGAAFGADVAWLLGDTGLTAVDVANPAAPAIIDHFTDVDGASLVGTGLAERDDVLLVANGAGAAVKLDVTDPAAPILITEGTTDSMFAIERGGRRHFVYGRAFALDASATLPALDDAWQVFSGYYGDGAAVWRQGGWLAYGQLEPVLFPKADLRVLQPRAVVAEDTIASQISGPFREQVDGLGRVRVTGVLTSLGAGGYASWALADDTPPLVSYSTGGFVLPFSEPRRGVAIAFDGDRLFLAAEGDASVGPGALHVISFDSGADTVLRSVDLAGRPSGVAANTAVVLVSQTEGALMYPRVDPGELGDPAVLDLGSPGGNLALFDDTLVYTRKESDSANAATIAFGVLSLAQPMAPLPVGEMGVPAGARLTRAVQAGDEHVLVSMYVGFSSSTAELWLVRVAGAGAPCVADRRALPSFGGAPHLDDTDVLVPLGDDGIAVLSLLP